MSIWWGFRYCSVRLGARLPPPDSCLAVGQSAPRKRGVPSEGGGALGEKTALSWRNSCRSNWKTCNFSPLFPTSFFRFIPLILLHSGPSFISLFFLSTSFFFLFSKIHFGGHFQRRADPFSEILSPKEVPGNLGATSAVRITACGLGEGGAAARWAEGLLQEQECTWCCRRERGGSGRDGDGSRGRRCTKGDHM